MELSLESDAPLFWRQEVWVVVKSFLQCYVLFFWHLQLNQNLLHTFHRSGRKPLVLRSSSTLGMFKKRNSVRIIALKELLRPFYVQAHSLYVLSDAPASEGLTVCCIPSWYHRNTPLLSSPLPLLFLSFPSPFPFLFFSLHRIHQECRGFLLLLLTSLLAHGETFYAAVILSTPVSIAAMWIIMLLKKWMECGFVFGFLHLHRKTVHVTQRHRLEV